LNNNQSIGYNALTGFAQGFSTGLSTTNNYYLKTDNWEVNKNFYSISSFILGAGIGTVLGLKDPRRFPYKEKKSPNRGINCKNCNYINILHTSLRKPNVTCG
jgi:hypothetical protein